MTAKLLLPFIAFNRLACKAVKGDVILSRSYFIAGRFGSYIWLAVAMFTLALPLSARAVTPGHGDGIVNRVVTTSSLGVSGNSVRVMAVVPTASTLELLQYAPAIGASVHIERSEYGDGGGVYTVLPAPVIVTGTNLAIPSDLELVASDLFKSGNPIFIRVMDPDQNLDPAMAETVVAQINSNSDSEEIRLTETGPNTGVFTGYVQTTANAAVNFNGELTVDGNSQVNANYVDVDNGVDVSSSNALIDPFGQVFSSADGSPVDGATVTLINVATGLPAVVLGDDGVSTFPSTVVTGGTVTDSSGTVYNFPPGGYRFPFVNPGTYRLDAMPPFGFGYPSTVPDASLQALPGAPFSLVVGSRNENFVISPGPSMHIDVPVDPAPMGLFLTKEANKNSVAAGDFLQYRINVQNLGTTPLNGVTLTDILPRGVRYQSGSLLIDGATVPDPLVSNDGQMLTINIGTIGSSSTVVVSYVTVIGAGTGLGPITNRVTAFSGAVTSNTAVATVTVKENLFRSRSHILGRVIVDQCETGPPVAGGSGLAGIRLFMEDGRNVITDDKGLYHFEAVKPGTHIVQIDKESVPDHLEIVSCEKNSRFAGTPYSRFVDLQGGSVWRSDFYLRPKSAIAGNVNLRMQSVKVDSGMKHTVMISGKNLRFRNRKLVITLPKGVTYVEGSSRLNGAASRDPDNSDYKLRYPLSDTNRDEWEAVLVFQTRFEKYIEGEHTVYAVLTFDSAKGGSLRSKKVENTFTYEINSRRRFVVNGNLAPYEPTLSRSTFNQLDNIIKAIKEFDILELRVTGHSDNSVIPENIRRRYADHYVISQARAEIIGEYFKAALGLTPEKVVAEGMGPDVPVADNDSEDGRRRNRRVEVTITLAPESASPSVHLTRSDSGIKSLTLVTGQVFQQGNDDSSTVNGDSQTEDIGKIGILSLTEGHRIAKRNVSIRLRLDSRLTPKLLVDGAEVAKKQIGFQLRDKGSGKTLYTYFNVDIGKPGKHVIEVKGMDPFGNIRYEQSLAVVRTGQIADIRLIHTDGNVADGKTPLTAYVQLLDWAGEVIHANAELILAEGNLRPYIEHQQKDLLERRDTHIVRVDNNGVILFAPTTRTGLHTATLVYNDVTLKIRTYVRPNMRKEWIMVGFAEGTFAHRTLSGNMEGLKAAALNEENSADGKLAFYAKGKIKGEWLLTLAYDSERDKEKNKDTLHRIVDPNRFYTLYGDTTEQEHGAPTREKLYVKLEREQFYALFGDYDTNMTVTELARYSRSLTGLKTEYESARLSINAFVAGTEQAFIKDEIRGDGTSGLYHLSHQNIVMNSEKISIEVRDRFHSERVLSRRTLLRHIDYTLDPIDGTLFFKEPVLSQDEGFNPIYIVVDYEIDNNDNNDIIAGGRIAVKSNGGNVEAGLSATHEGTRGAEGDLYGIDLTMKFNGKNEFRAEYARSKQTNAGVDFNGDAYLAEISHRGARLDGRFYAREQEAGFGLGQQKGSETATRKVGVEAQYRHSRQVSIHGEAWREENQATEATRDVVSSLVRYSQEHYTLSAGLRHAEDTDGAGVEKESDMLLAGASRSFINKRINLRANSEIAVGDNANPDFPSRYILGADFQVVPALTLFTEQEITKGQQQDTQSTRVGFKSNPWRNATFSSAVENQRSEYGPRTFATVGLTQGVQITENLDLDFSLDRTKTMREPGNIPFNVNVPPASGTVNDDFTAVSAGATYRKELWSMTGRIENRNGELEDKAGFLLGFYRQQTPGLGFAASLQYFDAEGGNDIRSRSGDLRFSVAYRPVGNPWLVLNRLDLLVDKKLDAGGVAETQKVVNNLNANYLFNRSNQLALQYGIKQVFDTFDDDEYDGLTQLFGSEYRYDINERWDIGVRAGMLHTEATHSSEYSWGLSAGVSFAKNVWFTFGYNVDGFEDDDFSAVGYTAKGPYIKFRFALDHQTARDTMAWWEQVHTTNNPPEALPSPQAEH